MPPQQLLALLDSADENPIAPDSAAIASQPSRSKTTPSLPVVVHVNTASAAQLETIPGIGPATAKSIIEYRQRRRLTSAEDLLDVKGIGKKKLERMRPFITVP
jgi:competence protein ComEA